MIGSRLACFIAGVIWVLIQGEYYLQGNVSWLTISAMRLLDGKDMLGHAYDSNPPLSILIYMPAVFLSDIFNLPVYRTLFIFTSFMIVSSAAMTWAILHRIDALRHPEKLIILSSFFCAVTIAVSIYVCEREHYIAVWLLPFILCQYCITERIKLPPLLLFTALCLGAVAVLIKPNFGIVPVAMIGMRLLQNKAFFKIVRDPDILVLSAVTLAYISSVLIFFEDYAFVIFPDALHFYFSSSVPLDKMMSNALAPLVIAGFLLLIEFAFWSKRQSTPKSTKKNIQKGRLVLSLYLCAFFALAGYISQGKGFGYHLLPAYVFILVAGALTVFHLTGLLLKQRHKTQAACSFAFIFMSVFFFTPWNDLPLPRHKDIKNTPLAHYLEQNCTAPCSFYAFHHSIEIINPTALYMDYDIATRFPALWFLPKMIEMEHSERGADTKDNALKAKERYTSYIYEDLEYYKPSILFIAKDLPVIHHPAFDFVEYFGFYKPLKNLIEENYRKDDKIMTIDISDYYPTHNAALKSVEYDVYKRIR